MKVQQAIQAVKKGTVAPVYVVYGTEHYLSERFEQTLVEAVIGSVSEKNDFNFVRYDLEETTLADVLVDANTLSFFSEPRIIWAHHAAFLTGKRGANQDGTDDLLAYLDDPNPDVVLCLVIAEEKLDRRKKVVKRLLKQATAVDTNPLSERDVTDIVSNYFQRAGKTLDRAELNFFMERTGGDLTRAMSEAEKLVLYLGERTSVTQDDIETVVAPSLDDNIFHLTDFLMQKQAGRVLKLYRTLIAEKQQPIAILALLESNLRLYVQVKLAEAAGYGESEIAKRLSVHPYRVKIARRVIRRFSLATLASAYNELIETEYRIKSGAADPDLALEWFFLTFSAPQTSAHTKNPIVR